MQRTNTNVMKKQTLIKTSTSVMLTLRNKQQNEDLAYRNIELSCYKSGYVLMRVRNGDSMPNNKQKNYKLPFQCF